MGRKSLLCSTVLMIGISVAMVAPSMVRFPSGTSTDPSLFLINTFRGALNTTSPRFNRPYSSSTSDFYYQEIELIVDISGEYFVVSGTRELDLYGCLYDTFFNPSKPYDSLIKCDDNTGGGKHFFINETFDNQKTYILIVTSYIPYATGGFQLTALGTGTLYMIQYTTQTTSQYGYIRSSNPKFTRPGGYSSKYYYDTIDITVNISGTYHFTNSNNYSTDIYACLYQHIFYPSRPSINQLECNEAASISRQFLIIGNLYASTKYILVVTTSVSSTTGNYSVDVEGPSTVYMSITTSNEPDINIVPIISGGVAFFIIITAIILIVVVYQHRKKAVYRQTSIAGHCNQKVWNTSYPGVHQTQTPYTISLPPGSTCIVSNKQ